MKRHFAIIAGLLFSAGLMQAQSLTGSWKGVLEVGAANLNIVFHVGDDKKVTMDSPDQGAMGIETTTDYLSADSISLDIAAIRGRYEGKLHGDELRGTFSQMGYTFPLNMKRGELQLNRPQTPVPPFEYATEEVSFENSGIDPQTGKSSEAGGARLAGTLTLPAGFKKGMPVVLMVTGSGQQNRDEELMGHKPFLVIADYLANHGIATLRYDDRGVGQSTGDYSKATTYDNMLDAKAGVEYLRATKKFGKIGVLGHSEGGDIAYMLASRGLADFVVALSGPVLPGDSILLIQNRDILSRVCADKALLDKYTKAMSRIMDYAKTGKKLRFSTPEMVVAALTSDMDMPEQMKSNLTEAYKMMDSPWMRYFISCNPGEYLMKLNCPAMLLFGEKDTQVSAAANIAAAQRLLPKKVSASCVIKEYPGLNHLFQPSDTGLPMEYGKIETTISETVLNDMAEWIGKNFSK